MLYNKSMENKEINTQIQELVLAISKEPKNAALYHKLAELYAEESKFDQVTSVYESLLNMCPEDVQALINMGSLWFYQKDYRKSLSYYNIWE